MKFQLWKLCRKKGDRTATRDGAAGDGVGVWSRAHSSKLKSKLQIGALGKEHRNLAENDRILLFIFQFSFENFRNLQNSPKNCQMYQYFDRYEKNPRLTNLQILEIRKIVPKVIKRADSWRKTEKSEFAKFENFWNLQDNFTIRQICRFVQKYNRKIQVGDSRHLRNSQLNEKS